MQAVPENEVAYHTGSSQTDPASGKYYTDEARAMFGHYATETNSPNNCTIGIELCPINAAGDFSRRTIAAAVELVADILRRHGMNENRITTHKKIVGWKNCPKLWTEHPEKLAEFREMVKKKMEEKKNG